MSKAKMAFLHILSLVFSAALVMYLWLGYLPMFAGAPSYSFIQNAIILFSILLFAVLGIQMFLFLRKQENQQ